ERRQRRLGGERRARHLIRRHPQHRAPPGPRLAAARARLAPRDVGVHLRQLAVREVDLAVAWLASRQASPVPVRRRPRASPPPRGRPASPSRSPPPIPPGPPPPPRRPTPPASNIKIPVEPRWNMPPSSPA